MPKKPTDNLSMREHQCLEMAANGYTGPKTAVALRLSERTVVYYLGKAQEKLCARSRMHAVAIAARRGIIRIEDANSKRVSEDGPKALGDRLREMCGDIDSALAPMPPAAVAFEPDLEADLV